MCLHSQRKCTYIIIHNYILFTIGEICTCTHIVDVSQIVPHDHVQSSAIDKLLLVSSQPETHETVQLLKTVGEKYEIENTN